MKKINMILGGFALLLSGATQAGLIGHWDANGNTNDSTGNNHGTLVGNTTYVQGHSGQAFKFDGNQDSVYIGPSLDVSTAFTLSAWINPISTSVEHQIFNNENSYEMAVISGTLRYAIETDTPGLWSWINTGINVNTNQWSFYALTYDGTHSRIYDEIGSLLYSTSSISGVVTNSSPPQVHIGSRANNAYSFHGAIDDVYVFDHALSAQEIIDVSNNAYSEVPETQVSEPKLLWLVSLMFGGLLAFKRRK